MGDSQPESFAFEDVINVTDVSFTKFEKVPRLSGVGNLTKVHIELDFNAELFPIKKNENLHALVTSLITPTSAGKTIMDEYDYVMCGKVFMCDDVADNEDKVAFTISFGGLLMQITGKRCYLKKFKLDARLYLLLRKEN
eukprot:GEMP01077320.1.p1 GENE.GEMP01077320.1~~GEMP01077320.1.p1  ORF type:complete len:139 (+),score=13.62 GEMP01077320.1:148-564(+)